MQSWLYLNDTAFDLSQIHRCYLIAVDCSGPEVKTSLHYIGGILKLKLFQLDHSLTLYRKTESCLYDTIYI